MRFGRSLLLVAAASALFASHTARAADESPGKVIGVANKLVSIAPFDDKSGREDRLKIFTCPSDDVQKLLGRLPETGDQVLYNEPAQNASAADVTKSQCSLRPRTVNVGFWERAGVVTGSAALLILLASLAAGQRPAPGKPRPWFGAPGKFLVGVDNRYSNSQVQLAVWFGVAATMYLAMMILRLVELGGAYLDGISLTANVMALTGLSALTFGGAKIVTAQKVQGADGAAAIMKPRGTPNLLTDLFQNDSGDVDIGDFQMILVVGTAVLVFGAACFINMAVLPYQMHVSLPDVDSSLLAGFGIGQGAYLVKKAALPLGKG